MRAAVLRDGRMIYRDDVPEPTPGPGQVLVEVTACGICGSDLHFATHGDEMQSAAMSMSGGPSSFASVDRNADIFMGHEFSAKVLQAGPGTETFPTGTPVTSIPVLLSGTGVEAITYSNNTVGGYAERMLLSAPLLLPIPNGLDPRHAALTEPMAVGLHAVNEAGIAPGDTALVLGCGPIGMAIIAALRALGVHDIVASDYSLARRNLAETMGAQLCVDPAQQSPFDVAKPKVIFEAIGVPGIIDDVMRRAPAHSRLIVAGVCMQPDTIHPSYGIAKEMSIHFVFGYRTEEFAASLHAIAEGRIDVAPLITGEVGLDGVDGAFNDLGDPDRHCKIVVIP